MELEDRIINQFHNSMEIHAQTIEHYTPVIAHASELMLQSLVSENKIICVGNGGSAALAQHFSTLMLNRFRHERPGLPVLNISNDGGVMSAISEDSHFNDVYSKQIRALGQPGDILLAITTNGRGNSLIQAIQAAHDREMTAIVLNGHDGGNAAALIRPDEIEICVPSDDEALVHGAHMLVLHTLSDLIDHQLFGA